MTAIVDTIVQHVTRYQHYIYCIMRRSGLNIFAIVKNFMEYLFYIKGN